MPEPVTLDLPLPPSLNRTYRVGRGAAGTGRIYKSGAAHAYAATCQLLGRRALRAPFRGAVALTLTIYRPRKAGDLDNYLKVLLDALQGVLYLRDSQVRRLVAGEVNARTGNAKLAMDAIGDRDIRQAERYLKPREDAVRDVFEAMDDHPTTMEG